MPTVARSPYSVPQKFKIWMGRILYVLCAWNSKPGWRLWRITAPRKQGEMRRAVSAMREASLSGSQVTSSSNFLHQPGPHPVLVLHNSTKPFYCFCVSLSQVGNSERSTMCLSIWLIPSIHRHVHAQFIPNSHALRQVTHRIQSVNGTATLLRIFKTEMN